MPRKQATDSATPAEPARRSGRIAAQPAPVVETLPTKPKATKKRSADAPVTEGDDKEESAEPKAKKVSAHTVVHCFSCSFGLINA